MNKEVEGKSLADSCRTVSKRKKDPETKKREYLSELSNFAFVLIGEGTSNRRGDKKEIYIVNEKEWKEYQRLKNKDERLIGYLPQVKE